MSEADLKALYDRANYYHIETLEESIKFLRLSGYSEEEIKLAAGDCYTFELHINCAIKDLLNRNIFRFIKCLQFRV